MRINPKSIGGGGIRGVQIDHATQNLEKKRPYLNNDDTALIKQISFLY